MVIVMLLNKERGYGYKPNPIFFSDKDIYVNFDKFKSGEIKTCLITALSGAGKSTITKKLSEEYKANIVSLDIMSWSLVKPQNANWENIKNRDSYLYMYLKEKKLPPTLMLNIKNGGNQNRRPKEKTNTINKYIYWLCFDRPDVDENYVIIEGGDAALALSHYNELLEMPIIFKGISLFKSILRRFLRASGKNGFIWALQRAITSYYTQYSLMFGEVDNARKAILTNNEYEEIDESFLINTYNFH